MNMKRRNKGEKNFQVQFHVLFLLFRFNNKSITAYYSSFNNKAPRSRRIYSTCLRIYHNFN